LRAELEVITVVSVIIFVLSVFGVFTLSSINTIMSISDSSALVLKAIAILSLAMAMFAAYVGVIRISDGSIVK
jgi:hypothetical protein